MSTYQKSFTSTTAVTEIDLTQLTPFDPNSKFDISDFDIEVIGNDAVVTMTAKGPFTNSIAGAVTDGTFAIAGAKKKIEKAALGSLIFTRVGTTSYSINVSRKVYK